MHRLATCCPFTASCSATKQRQGHSVGSKLYKVCENTYFCIYVPVVAGIPIGLNNLGINFIAWGLQIWLKEKGVIFVFVFASNLFFCYKQRFKKKYSQTIYTNLDLMSKSLLSRIKYLIVLDILTGYVYNRHCNPNIFKSGSLIFLPNPPSPAAFTTSVFDNSLPISCLSQSLRCHLRCHPELLYFLNNFTQVRLQNLVAPPLTYAQNKTTSNFLLHHAGPNHSSVLSPLPAGPHRLCLQPGKRSAAGRS